MNINTIFKTSVAEMVDYLIDEYELNQDMDHSYNEMKSKIKPSMRTIVLQFPALEELGIVEVTRVLGNLKMFKLADNPLTHHLVELRKTLKLRTKE